MRLQAGSRSATFAAAVAAVLALLALSCSDGGDGGTTASGDGGTLSDLTSDGGASGMKLPQATLAFGTVIASPTPTPVVLTAEQVREAAQRYSTCLVDEGYPSVDGVVTLNDGTTYRVGDGGYVTPALVEYNRAVGRCEKSSGMDLVRKSRGITGPPPTAAVDSRYNKAMLAMMECMREFGWNFREVPPTRGPLIPDPVIPPGQEDKYHEDRLGCLQYP